MATEWLAAKPDLKTMKRDDYKAECIDGYSESAGEASNFAYGLPRASWRA